MFENILLALAAGVFLALIVALISPTRGVRRPGLFEAVFFVVLFLVQAIVTYNTYFFTSWDPSMLFHNAVAIVDGNGLQSPDYFSTYPNNIALLKLEVLLVSLHRKCGFFDAEIGMFFILLLQCLINTLTGLFTFEVLKRFSGRKAAVVGEIIYLILIGSSGWIGVPYSDSMTLLFPILTIYLWECKKNDVTAFLAGFFSIVGAFLKPQVAIPLIAIIILAAFGLRREKADRKTGGLKRLFILLSGALIGMLLMLMLTRTDYDLNKEGALGMPHYFMMGSGEFGVFSGDDVLFSESFETRSERNKANLKEGFSRIRALGFKGFGRHLRVKSLVTYADGTFAFGQDESFFEAFLPDKSFLSHPLRNVLYGGGRSHQISEAFRQGMWLVVLFFALLSFFQRRESKTGVMCLTLLGFFIYEMIFEVRARYVYIFVPIYICLAIDNLTVLHNVIFKRRRL